jgi:hypothetical protein
MGEVYRHRKENAMAEKQIYERMGAIMAEVGAIAKDRKAGSGDYGFQYRGIDDTYMALHELMAKNGVFTTSRITGNTTSDRTNRKGSLEVFRQITVEWTFWAPDGSSVVTETPGDGLDSGDKGAAKAMSVAHRTALLQVFMIPVAGAQPDNEIDGHDLIPPANPEAPAKPANNPPAAGKPAPIQAVEDLDKQVEDVLKAAAVAGAFGDKGYDELWANYVSKSGAARIAYGRDFLIKKYGGGK